MVPWAGAQACTSGKVGPECYTFSARVGKGLVLVPKCPADAVGSDGYVSTYMGPKLYPPFRSTENGDSTDFHGLTDWQIQVNVSNDSVGRIPAVTTDVATSSVTTIHSPPPPQLPPSEQLNLVLVGYGESGKSSLMRRPIPHVGVKSTIPGGGVRPSHRCLRRVAVSPRMFLHSFEDFSDQIGPASWLVVTA